MKILLATLGSKVPRVGCTVTALTCLVAHLRNVVATVAIAVALITRMVAASSHGVALVTRMVAPFPGVIPFVRDRRPMLVRPIRATHDV